MPEPFPTPGPRPTGPPRVMVTGIGLITGLGMGSEATWEGLRSGGSAARILPAPPAGGGPPFAGFPLHFPDHDAPEILSYARDDALRDAGILRENPELDLDRWATFLGVSKGYLQQFVQLKAVRFEERVDPRIAPDRVAAVLSLSKGNIQRQIKLHALLAGGRVGAFQEEIGRSDPWADGPASATAREWDFRGPCLSPIAACATGVVAVLRAADLIRRGACDVAIAGSGDCSLEPFLLAAFRKMKALARVDGDPAAAVRSWDRDRSGFLVGEGAAVLVLEREDHARARGVLPYAEVAGGALGSDAYHMTDLNPDPANLAGLIGRALADASSAPEEIDHINVHGTATRSNDPLECRAIRLALGRHADRVACSANKAQIGHLLGAAGSAELAITCLAIRDGFVPPTLNLTDPDPACDLDGTPSVGRSMPIRAALKLSLGFGGHLAAVVLRRPEGPRREGPP